MNFVISKDNNRPLLVWLCACIFFVTAMIFIGGITRLTDSGLSITQWDPISGIIPPLSTTDWQNEFELYRLTPEFKAVNFNITMSEFKSIFLMEYFHRVLGRLTAFIFLVPFMYFSFIGKISKYDIRHYIIVLATILLQGGMGWYMVKSGLIDKPDVSHFRLAAHLALAIIILSLLLWKLFELLPLKFDKFDKIINLRRLALAITTLIFIQMTFGAFVAGLDGGMIYNSFPLMGNSIIPEEFYKKTTFLSWFYDPAIVQFLHRGMAFVIFIYVGYFSIRCIRTNILKIATLLLSLLLTLQIIVGIITLVWQVPVFFASLHQVMAALLYSVSLYCYFVTLKSES